MLACSRALAREPSRDDLVAVRGSVAELTYAELRAGAAEVARAGAGWSDYADDRSPFVAVLCDWNPEFLRVFAGLASSGWAVGVLDPSWDDDEIAGAVAQLDPCVVLVSDGCARSTPGLTARGWRAVAEMAPGWTVLRTGASGAARPAPAPSPDAPFYVGFTSGSSGRPKAFVRSHRSWWLSFEGLGGLCPIAAGEAVLVPGPLSSSHFLFGALQALHAGAAVELVGAAEQPARRIAQRVREGDPLAAVYVVPTMLAQLARDGATRGADPRFIFCAGARLDAEVRAAAAERFPGSGLVEYYGASELSFVAIQLPGDRTPPGAVGRAFPGVEISVRDDGDRVVPAGTTGVIFARGPLVFAGYRGEPPSTGARAVDGGWWTVGDRGRLDEAGNLFVAGRGSGLIVSGGANVQPEEVEEVVVRCPGVADCVVVGAPDPIWGEVVVAAVVVEPGRRVTRADLRRHAAASLARHKRPRRYVRLAGPIPVGRAGKVDRGRVRELVMDGSPVDELR